ncbi:MAG TPA: hypothetical protein VF950_03665 [Planctomycetota bacterium]
MGRDMEIRVHPPERLRRSAGVSACCCCCCCCCCLHTIGGVVGAAVGGKDASGPEELRTLKVYWLSFAAVMGVTLLAGAATDNFAMAFILIAGALPLGQLFTSLLVLVMAAVLPNPLHLPTLGRVTWKSVLWSVVGLLIWLVPILAAS